MKLFRTKAFITCIISIISHTIYGQDSIPLSLEFAVQLAIQKNTDIAIANYQVNTSEFALKEAKGNFLPKVSLDAGYNRNIEKQVIFFPDATGTGSTATELGSDNDYSSSIGLSVPLFSNYNSAAKKVAKTTLGYQNEVARGTLLATINTTKKSYFNYLIAQEVVSVQQSQLRNSEENLLDIQKRRQQGKLTDYDLTSAKVQVAQAKNSLLEAQSNIIPAANDLKLLLGFGPNNALRLTDPIALMDDELALKAGINQVLQQNSTLKQLELDIDLKEKKIGLVKSAFYPTLDIIGDYSYQAQADDFKVSDYDWVHTSLVGLQMNFSVFNGNVTKNKLQQAKIDKEIAQKRKDYATREYQMQFEELLSQLDFSRQKVVVQKENMELTAEALALAKKRYQYGVGTFLEVNDAETSYTQARLNWLQAISNYNSAYYDYQLLIGKE